MEKSFDDLKNAIENIAKDLTQSQKDLLLLKGLTDQKRNALGILHQLDLKLEFIIDNEGTDHKPLALNRIVADMNFFNAETAKFEFRDFVKTECKNKTETGFREHCQVLAYAALMIERTDEIVLSKTMALLAKSGSFSSLDYSSLLKDRKETALKFLEDIFTSTDENAYSYISCGLSDKSNAKLTDEQKSNLFAYAEHLDPDGLLKKRLEQREDCVDGSYAEPWKTYSRSSPDRNAALDKQMADCCKNGRKMEIMTYSEAKDGGVDYPYSPRCNGNITLGYCPGVPSNEIIPGTDLRNDDTIESPNGRFKLIMQTDGNLVFKNIRFGRIYWQTKTRNKCPGSTFHFTTDGNIIIYDWFGRECWSAGKSGSKAIKLILTDDGNLKLTNKAGDIVYDIRKETHHIETGSFTLDGGDNGDAYGIEERCQFPYYVTKMELKIETYQRNFWGTADNTALNGIKLTCSDDTTTITSTVGKWGKWYGSYGPEWVKQCPAGQFIYSAKIRKEDKRNRGDDSAANGIKFRCTGSNDEHSPGNGLLGRYIHWQDWKSCKPGSAIIGLRTLVEPPQPTGHDDTALNRVVFFCAELL